MRRKLTFATLLSLSVASPMTWALGVGDVDVRSPLNAPLKAVIPLNEVTDLDPRRLKVSLAETSAFERAGLERTPLAASVDMAVRQRDGQWVVQLASERPVHEPWLDLLLRFDWPGGRLLREVTLLLDPPNYDELPVLAGTASRPPATGDDAEAEASTQATPQPPSTESAGEASTRGAAWVGSGDTLWSVAGRLRPDDAISMNQMMVALIEVNPEVFPSGNINAMRAGHPLTVPPREAILSRSVGEADRIVTAMNQAWAQRDGGAPAAVSLRGTAGPAAVASASASQAAPSGERSFSPEAAEGAREPPRLTLLSDAEVAAETVALAEAGEGGAPTPAELDPGVVAQLATPELALMGAEERREARWQANRQALEAERDALRAELGGLREELEVLRTQLTTLMVERRTESGESAGGVTVPQRYEDEREAPWWGAVYSAETNRHLVLGGAGIAALLGLWLLVRWRRRRDEAAAQGGAFVTLSTVSPAGASPEASRVPGMASSAAPEATEPDKPAVRPPMPQAEAINEADIFMAYGRYDQARELLEAGIARDPLRHDLRFKLLTACVEQGDCPAAEREARWLRDNAEPALVAEVERLMEQHPPKASSESTSAPTPPHAGDGEAPASETSDSEAASPGTAATERGATASFVVPPRFEPPASEAATSEAPSEPEEARPSDARGAPARDDHDWSDLSTAFATESPQPASEGDATERPDEPSSTDEHGGDESVTASVGVDLTERAPHVIDYQPPALDPAPAAREETPMQPSVEFTPRDAEAASPLPGERSDGPGDAKVAVACGIDEPASGLAPASPAPEDDWEVEEVAFPPLDDDNGRPINADVAGDSLDEARQLIAAGESERARALLQRLLVESDDDELCDAARGLIDHHRL